MEPYIVYIKVDNQNRIIDVDSSAFLPDVYGWVEIDSGHGDKYHHAQGNYFPKHIMDERGVFRYLYTPDGETLWRERTADEMDADYAARPAPPPTDTERIARLEAQLAAYEAAYNEGVQSV